MYSRKHTSAPLKIASCTLAAALFISVNSQAEWLVEPEINGGTLELNEDFEFSPGEDAESSLATFAMGVQGGYLFSNHLFIKAGLTSGESENLLGWNDRIKFYDSNISGGVDWPISDSVSILGSVGMSFWDYDIKDQDSFNSNQKDKHVSGTGFQYRIGMNFRFNDLLSMGLHYGEKDWGDDVNYQHYGISLGFHFD